MFKRCVIRDFQLQCFIHRALMWNCEQPAWYHVVVFGCVVQWLASALRSWVKNQQLSVWLPPSDTLSVNWWIKLVAGFNVRGRIVCLLGLNCWPVQGAYPLALWQLGQAPRGEESRWWMFILQILWYCKYLCSLGIWLQSLSFNHSNCEVGVWCCLQPRRWSCKSFDY